MAEGDDQGNTYAKSRDYWDGIEPTVDGMLGGFSKISNVDAQESIRLLSEFYAADQSGKKAENGSGDASPNGIQRNGETRALDCGSGIGRVTKHVLLKFFQKVDLLEQNKAFLDKSKEYIGEEVFNKRIDNLFCAGLQDFHPKDGVKYDLIWCQWVTGYLTDDHFMLFLQKCKSILLPGGLIIIKDNHTSSDEIDTDMNDSSVTRSYKLLIDLFKKSGLTVACERRQVKFPRGLYPVKMFVLK